MKPPEPKKNEQATVEVPTATTIRAPVDATVHVARPNFNGPLRTISPVVAASLKQAIDNIQPPISTGKATLRFLIVVILKKYLLILFYISFKKQ